MKTISLRKKVAAVAVASLGFGVITSIAPVNAAPTTATSVSVSPIRASFQGATADTVPVGTLKFTTVGALLTASTTGVITLSTAPTSTAEVTIDNCGGANGTVFKDTVGGNATNGATALHGNVAATTEVSCDIFLSTAPASGTYAGKFVLTDAAGSEDVLTVNFSFTTAGAPKSIKLSKTTLGFPAVALNGGAFVGFETVDVSLLDINGIATQPSVGDSIVVSSADYTNIGLANSTTAASADLTVSSTNLADGTHTLYIGAKGTTADSEAFTFTPAGVLPGNGVVAVKLTATSAAIGTSTSVVTAVTAPTSASVIKAGATAIAKTADTSVRTVSFSVGGWPAGSAYKIGVAAVDGSGGANLTATINDVAGLTSTLYGISTGVAVPVVVTLGGTVAATDRVEIDGNGDGDVTDTSDMVVTLTAATYAVTLTTPAVTPSIAKTGAALVVAGKVADSYSTPVGGATVSVSGAQTLSTGTAANLTASATSAADGTFSVTLAAANALTTSVALTVTATKTGITGGITEATATVNLNAAGGADTMTVSLPGDEDSATVKTAATQLPAVLVPYTGRADGISDELYVVSTGAFANADFDAATETCFAVSVNTSPGGQVVATGTAGVMFYTSACTTAATHDVSAGVATATVAASGGDNLWVTSTKTGLNTFTVTSGTVTNTYRFYAYNQIAAGNGHAMRNVGAPATAKAAVGGISYLTLTPTDAFGNVIKSVANNAGTITVKAAGGVLLDGPVLSRAYNTTDADGNILIGIIAGTVEGAASFTVTSTGAQFGAAAGAATGTTAGTNGLTASVSTATIAVTVGGSGNPNSIAELGTRISALNARVVALNALIAKIMKRLNIR